MGGPDDPDIDRNRLVAADGNHLSLLQRSQQLHLQRKVEKQVGTDEAASLYRSAHRDLALNELFEATAKYSELRATVVAVPASSRGVPLVADLPAPDIPGTRVCDHEGEATS